MRYRVHSSPINVTLYVHEIKILEGGTGSRKNTIMISMFLQRTRQQLSSEHVGHSSTVGSPSVSD